MKTMFEQLLETINGKPFLEEVSGIEFPNEKLKDGRNVEVVLTIRVKKRSDLL